MESPTTALEHIRFAGEETRLKRPRLPLAGPAVRREQQTTIGECAQRAFVGRLLEHFGLRRADYRPSVLERRAAACLRFLRVRSVVDAERLLERRPELLPGVLDSVLIGVSSFFRDPVVFEQLAREVLPLLKRRSYRVRVLSAGAAEGQELYSLAMLLAEAGMLGGAELLGVDARKSALRLAAAGWYSEDALGGVDAARRLRFFAPVAGGWQILSDLRATACWEEARLPEFRTAAVWDLILCRNVSIYLDPAATQRLWRNLADSLSPGGCLVLGKAEQLPAALGLTRLSPCIFQKHSSSP